MQAVKRLLSIFVISGMRIPREGQTLYKCRLGSGTLPK